MKNYRTEDDKWLAVTTKDPAAPHAFYYAVKTTGIFCIVGCPSRRPKRENVEYFDTVTEAQEAGFRPCKRCRPDKANHLLSRIVTACQTIQESDIAPSLEELARHAQLSPHHFLRVFKAHVGITPKAFAHAIRDSRVRTALSQGISVTQALFDAGFGAASRFYERSSTTLGMQPSTYRKGGKGLTIKYATATSFLGPIIAGFTEKGVCAVEFGTTKEALPDILKKRFPLATLINDSTALAQQVQAIADFIQTPSRGMHLPLDIQGTAFQQRVWQELLKIPAGETRTYSDIASALHTPQSVRAVASACAKNKIAVAIPCHRVVRKDGSLSGYYWGIERKKALLDKEKEDN